MCPQVPLAEPLRKLFEVPNSANMFRYGTILMGYGGWEPVGKMTVTVWNTPVEINIAQKSETYWVASGDHLGKSFAFRGRSEAQAVEVWMEAARTHATQTLVARLTINRI